MMSFVGMLSLPVLLLSLVFILFHSKFVGLYNAYTNNRNFLFELMLHKYELLLFFSQDVPECKALLSTDAELSYRIAKLEDLLKEFDFSDDDSNELTDITKEIEEAQNMYNQSKENFYNFTHKFPGKLFATFLMDKSMKQ